MPKYFLPEWVHMCFTSDGTVFLDVKTDIYFGLNAEKTLLLRALADGRSSTEADALARDLFGRGLLTTSTSDSRPIAPTHVDPPDALLLHQASRGRSNVTVLIIVRFISACLSMWIALRLHSLQYALGKLRAGKLRIRGTEKSIDPEDVKRLATAFSYLRPLFYGARENCLYDSLVLCDFFRRFRVPATCVFGVKTLPFEAHCWVQVDRFLVHEETPETISMFARILAI